MTLLQQKRQSQENPSFTERETDENVIRSVPKNTEMSKAVTGVHIESRDSSMSWYSVYSRNILPKYQSCLKINRIIFKHSWYYP
jgi:hypothetical protein